MPTVIRRKDSFLAQVRIKGFSPAAKTFRIETTATAAKAAANAWGKEYEKELRQLALQGGVRADLTRLTVGALIKEFTKDDDTKQLKSLADLERILDWWTNRYGTQRVREFGVGALREARDKLKKPGRAAGTVNRHLSGMRACWNWGRSQGLIPLDRVWPPRLMLKEPRGRTRYLSDEEIARLLKTAESDSLMRAAILVSIDTGLRQGELLRLKWTDIDFAGAKVTVRESKNDDQRAVHLTSAAIEALKQLRKEPVVSPVHVFVVASGKPLRKSWLEVRWRKIRDAAALTDFRWHDLRHTCASHLAQNGATLLEIGSVLGHKSPAMTMRYSHLLKGAPVTGHAELDKKLGGKPKALRKDA